MNISGNILMIGGAGYLGRATLRAAKRDGWDARFTIYSRDEEKQFKVRQQYPDVRCILGDIRNLDRLMLAMQGHETVIHMGAVKFVPEAELNVMETVEVNIQGSMNVALAAHAARVKTVVGISTDKACLPVNLYGATKMVMERVFGEANNWGDTRFVVTRYGNVIGSTGSIIPVFMEMLRRDGKVRVTDPLMTRFWLSADDAVQLVAGCVQGAPYLAGSIAVPTPDAMRIGELAKTIVKMHPVRHSKTCDCDPRDAIEIVGVRPGEKTHESLVSAHEAARCQWYNIGATDGVIGIRPPGTFTKQRASDGPHAYSSDAPRRWITHDEMADAIEDSMRI